MLFLFRSDIYFTPKYRFENKNTRMFRCSYARLESRRSRRVQLDNLEMISAQTCAVDSPRSGLSGNIIIICLRLIFLSEKSSLFKKSKYTRIRVCTMVMREIRAAPKI